MDWATLPACNSILARRLLNLNDGIKDKQKRTSSEMSPTIDTVSTRVRPPLFLLTNLKLALLFVVALSFPASAQGKEWKFFTDPPGANVERMTFEGEWNYVGVADGEPIRITLSEVEKANSVVFRFVFPSSGGESWVSEKYEISGLDFLKSSRFPKDGPAVLEVPRLLAWKLWVSRHPFQAGLLFLGLPGLILALFLSRGYLLELLRGKLGVESGERFSGYNVLGELGKGAMGIVYLGEDQGGLKVAIKSVLPEYAEDPEFEKRFEHEVRACISLKHPNLLRYYGHGVDSQGVPFSVTELLEGRTLKQVLAEGAPQPNRLASDVIEQIGGALDYLHGQGLVHRDIKPDNIFVCDDGNLKLMDLGLVKGEAMTLLTRTGNILGTPAYMPPEQFDGQTSPAADQYALGIILYEILAGERPFVQPDMFALAYQHKTAAPQPLTEREPRVTQEVNDAVLKMISKKPSERFQSLEEIRQAISDKLLYLRW